jgi:hypothetical protein
LSKKDKLSEKTSKKGIPNVLRIKSKEIEKEMVSKRIETLNDLSNLIVSVNGDS